MATDLSAQKKIVQSIGLQLKLVRFHFTEKDGHIQLTVFTKNPHHKQEFIYHTVTGLHKKDALQKMLAYAIGKNRGENSYTIQWRKTGDTELHTSYFSGKNIYVVLDKFFSGKNMNNYIVFTVGLNPVS